jgi:hypothetical protein
MSLTDEPFIEIAANDVEFPMRTDDARYIFMALIGDWMWNFGHDNKEYLKPRRFGVKAEYIEMVRKLEKLEAPLWDGADTSHWRETPRKVLQELIAHAFLAMVSLDDEAGVDIISARFRLICVENHKHEHRDCWGITDGPD